MVSCVISELCLMIQEARVIDTGDSKGGTVRGSEGFRIKISCVTVKLTDWLASARACGIVTTVLLSY
jgi:hypothetical protein